MNRSQPPRRRLQIIVLLSTLVILAGCQAALLRAYLDQPSPPDNVCDSWQTDPASRPLPATLVLDGHQPEPCQRQAGLQLPLLPAQAQVVSG